MQLLFRKENGNVYSKLMMEKYELIEKESINQIDKLPVVYKRLQYDIDSDLDTNPIKETIHTKSNRHQTPVFEAVRFYKNIEIFLL